jgi:hypothetical protein
LATVSKSAPIALLAAMLVAPTGALAWSARLIYAHPQAKA